MTKEPSPNRAGGVEEFDAALQVGLSETLPGGWFRLIRRRNVLGLCLLSAGLLFFAFPPFGMWYLAYVALVPWGVAMVCSLSSRWAVLFGWLAWGIFWVAAVYWLYFPTGLGFVAAVVYLSGFWWVGSILFRFLVRRGLPAWVTLPFLWVSLELARAYMLNGFPWFNLSATQARQTQLIQLADLTGQYGVSFFVAMVNGILIDLLVGPMFHRRRGRVVASRSCVAGAAAVVVLGGAMLGYGQWRMKQSEGAAAAGPKIGIVQEAIGISLGEGNLSYDQIFHKHLLRSLELRGAGCDVVLWPETMLPTGMNRDLLEVDVKSLSEQDVRSLSACMTSRQGIEGYSTDFLRTFLLSSFGPSNPAGHRRLAEEFFQRFFLRGKLPEGLDEMQLQWSQTLRGRLALMAVCSEYLGCDILAGGATHHRNPDSLDPEDRWVIRNSILRFGPGGVDSRIYSKMLLVPFSEYVPLKDTLRPAYDFFRWFVPPSMPQLDPGREAMTFPVGDRGQWNLAPTICYEGTLPRVCRKIGRAGPKNRTVLLNLSNDGWFVVRPNRPTMSETTEQAQHLEHYVFRAIENRMPVVRSVNTGISGWIDSNGRIQSILNKIDANGRKNTMVGGTLLVCPSVDSRVSVYSLRGDLFARMVSAMTVVAVGWIWSRKRIWSTRK